MLSSITILDVLKDNERLRLQVARLTNENESLKQEVISLKQALGINEQQSGAVNAQQELKETVKPDKSSPMYTLSADEKVALFRSLFRGREDVFARRWFSASSGKSGYQPVCSNEWRTDLCDKKQYKCADCPNRKLSPLTDKDIYNHLSGSDVSGRDVIGLFPLLEDNTCYLLCADFDDKNSEHGYQEDVLTYKQICNDWHIPAYIERSRSGNDAHVWIFFSEPIPAATARRLGYAVLTESMNHNGKMSLKSYDRFFPNQDTLPEGGFGNLVALPLQGQARKNGNSSFMDELFNAYPDQWQLLQSIERLSLDDVTAILAAHNTSGSLFGELAQTTESKPWDIPKPTTLQTKDMPTSVTLVRANGIYLPLDQLSAKLANHLKRMAAFRNLDFYAKQAMRFSTYDTPRIISCAEITDDYLHLPRGCEDAVCEVFKGKNIPISIEDKTQHGSPIKATFVGDLRPEQQEALHVLCRYNKGTLSASPAFGKTVTAAALIAERQTNTLVLVHTKALLQQWQQTLCRFLDIEITQEETPHKRGRKKKVSSVGTLDSAGNHLNGIVDVALMQSCLDEDSVKPFMHSYGMVIVDECHHVSAVTFEKVLRLISSRYVYGLTATPIRKDGHQPIIFMQCGPICYQAAKQLQQQSSIARVLVPRFTAYRHIPEEKITFQRLTDFLISDEARNRLIVSDVQKVLVEGRTPIILTSRTSHVNILSQLLSDSCQHIISLVGSASAREKRQTMERLYSIPTNESLVIVATGKYVGEGFDFPRLDTLMLAVPVSWKGIVEQYAGRLHRNYPSKHEVHIYDYVDIHVPLCELMYRRRIKGYAAIGYKPKSKSVDQGLFADLEMPDTYSPYYDGKSFALKFRKDISQAKRSIIIACPNICLQAHSPYIKLFAELSARGVGIVVYTKENALDMNNLSDVDMNSFAQIGVTIVSSPNLSCRCAIIDKKLIWYGSINYLGKNSFEDNAMRIGDALLANDLLDVICKTPK